jgi:threonyl-tRNA synthetase
MLDEHDHRSLGQRLDLFHLQEEAPGMVFWHPRGLILYNLLEEHVRRRLAREGYREVRTPQVMSRPIWEASGHWGSFSAGMFKLDDGESALKPVSCPGHVQIASRMARSYRDLPVRLSEFGLVHRDEPRGALLGLFRLRQFTQDDGHIFCAEESISDEVARFSRSLRSLYAELGFPEIAVGLSGRPSERLGDDAVWDRAEAAISAAAKAAGLDCAPQPGEGAFYGPKLEFALKDRHGKAWQCGTIQLDLVLPERFGLAFVDAAGQKRRPAILHRAFFGSVERFLGLLLERHRGALPPFLAPEQARVAPVAEAQRGYAEEVLGLLLAAGLRAGIDARPETLGRRAQQAREDGVPWLLVVGKREESSRAASLRDREGAPRELPLAEAISALKESCRPPS